MLFQVGGQGTRPTFFEMAAAQQLPSSLRTALNYSLGILALRRPILHKVLDYESEFFAVLMTVLETHSLRTTDASFSESLYGLRRRAVKFMTENENSSVDSEQLRFSSLRRRQRILSVVFLVILPYMESKLYLIYNEEREARLQAALWGNDDDAMVDESLYMPGREGRVEVLGNEASRITHIKKKIVSIIAAFYPFLHATNEGFSFAYQLLYLLDATRFYTPALHILGIHVCRVTGQELMDSSSRISRIRNNDVERLRGPPWFKAVQKVLLNSVYFTLDYAQTGLIASVFFFKMMEWWYQSAEERMSAPTVYPPPPPPPVPKVAKGGIPLPTDRRICPLCSQKRLNPAVVAVSGFVFCYTCIFKYISQYKRCPISLQPATVDQIRRLFHDL